ncbi:MAG: hypothetical protein QI197_05555 [Candidatus Korarchaeota archaeon]|nr:hypothetical protein [Candidatus Korarchaeota archaeon]
MIPEAIDLLCIPVLMNEVPLRPLRDDEARRIAEVALKTLPTLRDMKVIVVTSLYYVSDLFSRPLLDEIPVNSVALAGLLERRGKGSRVYAFNPFTSNGLIPTPNGLDDGSGRLTWAVIPVVAFGDGYVDLDEYFLEQGNVEGGIEELERVLAEIYSLSYIRVFPPVMTEDLLEEITLLEEDTYQDLGRVSSAG